MPSSWKKSFLRHLLLLALRFTFVTMRSAIQLPTNSIKINDTSVYGRNATLRCPVFEIGGHRVAWMRYDTRTILSLHGELVTQSNRYAIINKEEGSYDLFITNVIDSDAGTYICQINSEPMKNLVIFLKVVKPPTIDEELTSDSLIITEGQTALLNCSASGDPTPKIYWRRQNANQMIRGLNKVEHPVLVLKNVQKKDAGNYLCIAKNAYPPAVSHTVKLFVHYKPRVTLAHSTNFQTGETEILCAIDAFPEVSKHGLMVGDEYVKPSHRKRFGKMELKAKVKVYKTTRVVCHGQNYLDEVSTTIFISGVSIPDPDSITKTFDYSDDEEEDENYNTSTSSNLETINDHGNYYNLNAPTSQNPPSTPNTRKTSEQRKRKRDRRKNHHLFSSTSFTSQSIGYAYQIFLVGILLYLHL
ncbi:protein amalgam isoform X1 [Lepeophtheirus salmonis]|uniref:protein amalgam isoform X1 n=2 Tax=Lepeophtheirus salmonis TaxID=72036 RepID=UPI001AEA60E3|nr:interference hedgehog-like isoform X1 [Lepeophtheirus salmonis]